MLLESVRSKWASPKLWELDSLIVLISLGKCIVKSIESKQSSIAFQRFNNVPVTWIPWQQCWSGIRSCLVSTKGFFWSLACLVRAHNCISKQLYVKNSGMVSVPHCWRLFQKCSGFWWLDYSWHLFCAGAQGKAHSQQKGEDGPKKVQGAYSSRLMIVLSRCTISLVSCASSSLYHWWDMPSGELDAACC